MPSQIKKKKNTKLIFHHFFTVKLCTVFKLVLCILCIKLNIFRTSSPPTSCYRLGLCPSTPSRSWWSWPLPALKNRPSVTITWTKTKFKLKLQLIKIKFTLNKIWNWLKTALLGDRETIWPCGATESDLGDRETVWPCGATESDLGDRETVPGHQGGAVVPDSVATHEIERPETHLLVKKECKK